MKIYVTGHKGRLGSELVLQGCLPLISESSEADITNPDLMKSILSEVHPDVIINCAAYTNVDACERTEEFNEAIQVNARGVYNLLEAFPGRILHISTDYVFDGRRGPYREIKSIQVPVNPYGWSKMGGEVSFLYDLRLGNILIRTTGLYGRSSHHDFVKLVVDALSSGKSLKVSSELLGNQTYIPHLAEALIHTANRLDLTMPILNIASEEVISRYEFAVMVADVFGLDNRLLIPVSNREVGWLAERPTKGGLNVGLAKELGIPIYSIKDGLEALRGVVMSA